MQEDRSADENKAPAVRKSDAGKKGDPAPAEDSTSDHEEPLADDEDAYEPDVNGKHSDLSDGMYMIRIRSVTMSESMTPCYSNGSKSGRHSM